VIAAITGMAQNYGIYTELFGFKPVRADDGEVIEVFTNIMLRGVLGKAARKATTKPTTKRRNRK
jgi:hypothetical protein